MELNVVDIMKLIPHRYPFLLVDRIIESEGDTKVVGIKNVTINEPFFQGHFPGHPIMPGVLIVEAMAQLGGAFVRAKYDIGDDKVTYFVGIDNVKFRKPVLPGDVLRFELELVSTRRGIFAFTGKAYVDGKLACEAELKATFADR